MTTTTFNGRGRLEQLVQELNRQKDSRLDFVADSRALIVGSDGERMRLIPATASASEFLPEAGVPITENALAQLGQRMTPPVPIRFMRELAEARPLRASELLTGLLGDAKDGSKHFVRVLDNRARAFLSDRYRVLDHYDLAFTALDVVREVGGEAIEATLTDKRMALKFTTRQVWESLAEGRGHTWVNGAGKIGSPSYIAAIGREGGELPGNDGNAVSPLVTISNSETGHGGLNVQVGLFKWACCNGAIIQSVSRQVHLGETMDAGVFSEETQAADSKAIMLKCRDAIRAAFTTNTFRDLMAKARAAASDHVPAPKEAVENVVKAFDLPESSRDSIMAYFCKDYEGASRWGLAQAVARAAQDYADGDAALDLEETAGKIIAASSMAAIG